MTRHQRSLSLAVLTMLVTELPAQPAIAIRGATVIAGIGTDSIAGATVLIERGRIAAVGPAETIRPPDDALIVDARGLYVIPGLIDMHVHMSKLRASAMGLFIVNGVTTIRDMAGEHAELLQWRREIRAGRRLGPRMLIAGPYLESRRNIERMRADPPEERVEPFERTRIGIGTPDEADRVIDSLARLELDFFKIRTVQDRATYFALNEAANRHGIKLVGHVAGIRPEDVLAAGQDGVEHTFFPLLDSLSRDDRMALWRQFAARRMPVVPTLVTYAASVIPTAEQLRAIVADTLGLIEPRRPYLSRFLMLDWREQAEEATDQRRRLLQSLLPGITRNLREMHEAGVPVLTGSDAAVVNVYPGSSLHEEMELFVRELGMTPAEVLERSTRMSAEALGIADSVGAVRAGAVADLVVLEANPLHDIRNVRRIAAVVVGGRYFDRRELRQVLQAVRASPDLRTNDWVR